MEHHLDRKVILSEKSEHKNLYQWFLRELGDEDKQVGRDQIPWPWTLWFTLSEITLFSSLEIDRFSKPDNEGKSEPHQRDFIQAKLLPSGPGDYASTSYFMFGTNRRVSDFTVCIYQTGDEEEEKCEAWGSVSYTAEIDFQDVTSDDEIIFSLYIKRERFARYARMITEKSLTRGTFRVGSVDGFYSDWSPSITTSQIKVLTHYIENHPVEIPEGCSIVPPRLGKVGKFELSLASKTHLQLPPTDEPDNIDEAAADERSDLTSRQGAVLQSTHLPDPTTIKILKSLRIAAWVIAALLLIVIIK